MTKNLWLLLGALAGVASIACESGGIGDPCIHEREYDQGFSGFNANEIDVESRSFQCKSRVCLVANFQGRASCPYGQDPAGSTRCFLPGTSDTNEPGPNGCSNCVQGADGQLAKVDPQLIDRSPEKAMYCSCRCNGPDSNVRYCECPSGFVCEKLISFGRGSSGQLLGSYCIKDGTQVRTDDPKDECSNVLPREQGGCGTDVHPSGI